MVPFESFDAVSYRHSIATTVVSLAVSTQCTNVTDTQRVTARAGLYRLARLQLRGSYDFRCGEPTPTVGLQWRTHIFQQEIRADGGHPCLKSRELEVWVPL